MCQRDDRTGGSRAVRLRFRRSSPLGPRSGARPARGRSRVSGSVVLQHSDGVCDGVQVRDIDIRLVGVGCNRPPNRVDLHVQTLNALLEQIDPVDCPEQQDDNNH